MEIVMEMFWCILAALGAGVGTGLAGLSAATIMVPILIVMCPSFAGEAGAYQATAIALASDILGSAVTSLVYIKHKNIDLRRGWIMQVCITAMCIAGSFVAHAAGNVVLGSFSLFLTLFIGIRFLMKPDTQRKNPTERGTKLDWKGILISLYFGLCIGFGTGFIGSGGGMMMLVVFTAFLGMDQKSAVGTSTFIMTFTALIAATSHILIEPSIWFERKDALIICVIVATVSSLVSAQFANRFPTRTVGLVTGGVLTVLGVTMLLLHYWDALAAIPVVYGLMKTLGWFLAYMCIAAAIAFLLNIIFHFPREVFRKSLHFVAFSSVIVIIYAAENWFYAAAVPVLVVGLMYPMLTVMEKNKSFTEMVSERRPGELKSSLFQLFLTVGGMIALCWGLLKHKEIAVAAILMWGFGDAAAALIGKRFGKTHVLRISIADHDKSWEGTAAMAFTACFVGIPSLFLVGHLPLLVCILAVVVAAPLAAMTELVTHRGFDTVTVPLVSALSLYAMLIVQAMV